jgi:hypothetical protein
VIPSSKNHRAETFWNILSFLSILGVFAVVAIFLVIFVNPQNEVNPLPPPTLPVRMVLPTDDPANPSLELPTNINTEIPLRQTESIQPTVEPPEIITTAAVTQSINQVPPSLVPFETDFVIEGTIQAVNANQYNPVRGCDWMGVAGQVFDLQNQPVRGIRISLRGTLDGSQIDLVSMTGTALIYGPAGYEFRLSNRPIASNQEVRLQLVDQAGLPLSDVFYFDTYAECEKNLLVINFIEVR